MYDFMSIMLKRKKSIEELMRKLEKRKKEFGKI